MNKSRESFRGICFFGVCYAVSRLLKKAPEKFLEKLCFSILFGEEQFEDLYRGGGDRGAGAENGCRAVLV